jgi:hypothetical protein
MRAVTGAVSALAAAISSCPVQYVLGHKSPPAVAESVAITPCAECWEIAVVGVAVEEDDIRQPQLLSHQRPRLES